MSTLVALLAPSGLTAARIACSDEVLLRAEAQARMWWWTAYTFHAAYQPAASYMVMPVTLDRWGWMQVVEFREAQSKSWHFDTEGALGTQRAPAAW